MTRSAARAAGAPAAAPRNYPIHPLFPLPEGEQETKEIHWITFDRWNQKGIKERCPDRYLASELRDFAQVVDMFGGGTYQFIALDSRGNFSRWTPASEKLYVNLPCKPLRPEAPRRAAPAPQQPTESRAAENPTRCASRANPHGTTAEEQAIRHMLAMQELAFQQSIAAQERAERFMLMLIDRLAPRAATPANNVAQERAERHALTLLDGVTARPAAPTMDPIAMMVAMATIIEKIRPAPSMDLLNQAPALIEVIHQLNGTHRAPASAYEPALKPLLTMANQIAAHQAQGAGAPPPAPTMDDLVWVYLPAFGPVQMRPKDAAAYFARSRAQANNTTPTAAPQPQAPTFAAPPAPAEAPSAPAPQQHQGWSDIVARLQDPKERAEFERALQHVAQQRSAQHAATTAPAPQPAALVPITAAPAPQLAEPEPMRGFWDDVAQRLREPDAHDRFQGAIQRRIQALSAPASTPPSPTLARDFWDDVAARLTEPDEQAAFKVAVERASRALPTTQPSVSPPQEPPQPETRTAPATTPPSPTPLASLSTEPKRNERASEPRTLYIPKRIADRIKEHIARPVPRCLVCQAPGKRDPAAPHVLICRNAHRSLIAAPSRHDEAPPQRGEPLRPAPASTQTSPPASRPAGTVIPFPALTIEQIDTVLADADALRELPAEVVEMFREMRAEAAAARAKQNGAAHGPRHHKRE